MNSKKEQATEEEFKKGTGCYSVTIRSNRKRLFPFFDECEVQLYKKREQPIVVHNCVHKYNGSDIFADKFKIYLFI